MKKDITLVTFSLTICAIGFIVFLNVANAQSSNHSVTPEGLLTLDFGSFDMESSAFHTGMLGYRNTYPATTTPKYGYSVSFGSDPVWQTFCSIFCVSSTSNTVVYDLEHVSQGTVLDGDYWFRLTSSLGSIVENEWYTLSRTNGVWSTLSDNFLDFDTRFTGGVVSGASSSTVQFDIDYILATSEFSSLNRPDYINVNTLADGFFNDQQVNVSQRFILPLTNGANSKNIQITDHNFEDGNYISYVNFWNINSNSIVFNQTGLHLSFEVSGGVVINSVVEEVFNGQNLSTQTPTADCSISNIGGCLINALTYVFIPSSESFSQFTGVWDSVSSKPPFGYITSTIDVFEGIDATTTPAFTFGTIPFMDTIFTPFRTLLVSLLWFIYAVWFYRKVTKINI